MADIPINTAKRSDFVRHRPEVGQFLIWDYYANNTCLGVVKVQKLKKSYFVIDAERRVRYEDGKVLGFDTAIVRNDPEEIKNNVRKMYEARLRFCDYEMLPGKVLRKLNAVIDAYEVEKKIIREQHAVASAGDVGASKEMFIARSTRARGANKAPQYKIGSSLLDDKPTKRKIKSKNHYEN